jgi:hypothetical protein
MINKKQFSLVIDMVYVGRVMNGMNIIFECNEEKHMREFFKHFGAEFMLKRTTIFQMPSGKEDRQTVEIFEMHNGISPMFLDIMSRREELILYAEECELLECGDECKDVKE